MIPGVTGGLDTVRGDLDRIARIADPMRLRRLDAYERLYKGLAYEGRPSFWDTSVPLQERAPCVTSGLPEAAGRRLMALVFGARQFPQVHAGQSEDAKAINELIARVVESAQLPLRMRAALEQGLSIGTWMLVLGLRDGVPCAKIVSAKYATPELDAAGRVRVVDIRYRYSRNVDGKPRVLWFRRTIDAQRDVVYQPAEALDSGRDPEWIEDAERSVTHGLGFCPVLWHRHNPDPSDTDELDGEPLFAGMEDELEALDFALSQRHRNGRYNGEPQIVVTGAQPEDFNAESGRGPRVAGPGASSAKGGASQAFSWFNSLIGGARMTESGAKKAPGKVWYFERPEASATMLESSGAGARVLSEDADGLRRAILEARQIVIASPEQVSANASAALMESLHAPMVDHADTLRLEYGPALVEVVRMLLRICAHYQRTAPGSVLLDGIEALAGANLDRLPIALTWGRYYEPTLSDLSQAVGAASIAAGGRAVLSHRTAVRFVASLFDVEDVDAELSQIDGAQSADQATLAEAGASLPVATDGAAAVADTALNGAQVTSLVEILGAVAARTLPVETAKPLILAAFPSFDDARVESMLAPLRNRPSTEVTP